ncbi:hypothetical protein SAMN04487866_1333 [Thermoactinomyces sp. DSM 45891]|uniref:hypothetical protein n=1 Tax=Thermoactinomyces sp. DSM 45891 TaxID=1761907 RepID=UPI00091E9F48|nr:hypothetical protein [Thermoactinomyces sp. DSM 45891]SFX82889.1 hypothetical protein SAMN04487866_1333 [Thermoactinomyces sp. DSM 45891]
MNKLTTALLAGKKYREFYEIRVDEEIYQIEIRPLTHIEKAEVQAVETASIKMNSKNVGTSGRMSSQEMEMNTADVIRDSAKAELKAVALGTVDPEWTEDMIDQLWKAEWIEGAYNRILEISGVANKKKQQESASTQTEQETAIPKEEQQESTTPTEQTEQSEQNLNSFRQE